MGSCCSTEFQHCQMREFMNHECGNSKRFISFSYIIFSSFQSEVNTNGGSLPDQCSVKMDCAVKSHHLQTQNVTLLPSYSDLQDGRGLL